MYKLEVDISKAQMKNLHKGKKVRVKKGTGFELLVNPTTYNITSKAFRKNKGSEIQLTPEELEMNRMHGSGFWDDLGNKIAGNLGRLADAGTGKLVSMIGTGHSRGIGDIASQNKLDEMLNEHLGSNYGYLSRAGLDNAINANKSAMMSKMGIDARMRMSPTIQGGNLAPPSRIYGGQLETSSIGRNGGMLSTYTPPALVSQPFSANFQFQHFLPPQYQHFNSGGEFDSYGSGFH
jgi:hypothetical protein